ncbi:Similar to S.cerevisiae protein YER134C (Magnesium-dependent acid phosphatase) [Malassezia sympodialis ATCC 42132]|uniref:Similar to S.cerevisiae protein YER134C (Magnesium-dependent acid phosphatase) n=1 Tax=Malassezia sympodialis (strain ATCC 42132) TaxID=1230383 RepID=A0A1M8A5T6_MALS4|nr:Similar to S.cerevisiae protein YER134C (Magnesium-dependent acid phosphatase) [Malassezia sympodialis ATCC 42132]
MRSAPEAAWPKLVVFDLDYTLWPLWVDTHVDPPLQRRGAALNEVFDRSGQAMSFYPDVPDILFELKRRNVLIAAASRTCAPRVARQALQGLWIAPTPGETPVPAGSLFDYTEIYPGSKVAHFQQLAQETGIDYADMLFFDDEHRNAEVQKKLGVRFVQVGHRGLTRTTFEQGLQSWRKGRHH